MFCNPKRGWYLLPDSFCFSYSCLSEGTGCKGKNQVNFLKIFWKSSFKISYFQKSFLHALAVLGYLPILKGCVEVTSFQCTFSTCFFHKIGSCLIFYQLTKFQYHLLSFLRYQIKCIFKFWFSQFITS